MLTQDQVDIVGYDEYLVGGGKSPVADLAIDNYEILYSLLIRATYEKRDVTQQEYKMALKKTDTVQVAVTPKAKTGISSENLAKLFGKKQLLTGMSAPNLERANEPWLKEARPYTVGGKSNYKKTRKQKKRTQTQKSKRKTRKQK